MTGPFIPIRAGTWHTGRRVVRPDRSDTGTIVEAGLQIKVQWDNGKTSYFGRTGMANVRLKFSTD